MPIKQTPESKPKIAMPNGSIKIAGEELQKPLLQITLPAPSDMNPKTPLSVGQHNACAQKNFKQIADIMQALINNQKLMSMAITELNKKVKELRDNDKKIIENIGKLVKEDKKNEPTTNS